MSQYSNNSITDSNSIVKQRKKPEGSGRAPGSLNVRTRQVKDALMIAFENIGGIAGLTEWGKANPTEFYKLWVKILPLQLQLSEDRNWTITVKTFDNESDADRAVLLPDATDA